MPGCAARDTRLRQTPVQNRHLSGTRSNPTWISSPTQPAAPTPTGPRTPLAPFLTEAVSRGFHVAGLRPGLASDAWGKPTMPCLCDTVWFRADSNFKGFFGHLGSFTDGFICTEQVLIIRATGFDYPGDAKLSRRYYY